MLKKLYHSFSNNWFIPILLLISGFIVSLYLLNLNSKIARNLSLIILCMSVIIALIFSVIRLIKKDFFKGLLQILTIASLTFLFLGFYLINLRFYPYDFFAEDLEIPNDIKFEKPLNSYEVNDSIFNVKQPTIVLFNGPQPGIYEYEIYLKKIEKGVVYLKLYEITTHQILSENNIEEETKMEVFNPDNELIKFKCNNDFLVHEGDWNKFYGSKIEVWFKPEKQPQKDRLLFSKNYIIQGWQR